MNTCCMSQSDELVILQGTTPPLNLNLQVDLSQGYDIRVAIKYSLTDNFIFTNDDMVISQTDCGSCIEIKLTQEQTFAMKNFITVQLRAKEVETGNIVETNEIKVKVLRGIDKELM